MKTMRFVAFGAALCLFSVQVALARQAGDSVWTIMAILGGVFGAFAILVWVLTASARRRLVRGLVAALGARPGWDGVPVIFALPAGAPAGTVRSPLRVGALLFSASGFELWAGKSAPFGLVGAGSWAQASVTTCRVSYVAGRAVAKDGVRLDVAGQHPVFFVPRATKELRAKFPADSGPESVVAAVRAASGASAAPAPFLPPPW